MPLTFRGAQEHSLVIDSISPIQRPSPQRQSPSKDKDSHMKIEEFCLPEGKKELSEVETGTAVEDKERRCPKTPGRIKLPFGLTNDATEDALHRQTPIELLRKKVGESSDLESSFYEGFK